MRQLHRRIELYELHSATKLQLKHLLKEIMREKQKLK